MEPGPPAAKKRSPRRFVMKANAIERDKVREQWLQVFRSLKNECGLFENFPRDLLAYMVEFLPSIEVRIYHGETCLAVEFVSGWQTLPKLLEKKNRKIPELHVADILAVLRAVVVNGEEMDIGYVFGYSFSSMLEQVGRGGESVLEINLVGPSSVYIAQPLCVGNIVKPYNYCEFRGPERGFACRFVPKEQVDYITVYCLEFQTQWSCAFDSEGRVHGFWYSHNGMGGVITVRHECSEKCLQP
jgi:hypothetical protein